MISRTAVALCVLVVAATPAPAAELAYLNGVEEGFSLWSSEAEFHAIWGAEPPINPWLLADAVASTYDVGSRALRAGGPECAYRLWLSLAQAGGCRAKFAVGYLLDPASPKTLATVTLDGHAASPEVRARAAFDWYLSAAEEGWPLAQRLVGDAYAAGQAVAADPETANLWYRRAARLGDPDAMFALATRLRLSNREDERVEGLTWALIALDEPTAFWFDDSVVVPLLQSYRTALTEQEWAAAWATAADWIVWTTAIQPYISHYTLERLAATRRMFADIPLVEPSQAAAFDMGALAFLEGRLNDAFLLWWPLASRGHCQAQQAVAVLLDKRLFDHATQGVDYRPEWTRFPSIDIAYRTARAHAAMQGIPSAQLWSTVIAATGDHEDPALEQAGYRWARRADAQGFLPMLREQSDFNRQESLP